MGSCNQRVSWNQKGNIFLTCGPQQFFAPFVFKLASAKHLDFLSNLLLETLTIKVGHDIRVEFSVRGVGQSRLFTSFNCVAIFVIPFYAYEAQRQLVAPPWLA